MVQETTPVQSKTKKQPGPNQVTIESIPADEIIPELGVTEESRVEAALEEQVLPRGTDQFKLPEVPVQPEIAGGMEEGVRRYPTRKKKPNVRLSDYVVEVDRVKAMAVRSYAEVLKGTKKEPNRKPGGRGQEIMMLSGVLEVVMEKLKKRMDEVSGGGHRG